jgi:hypothetical protein
MAILKMENIVVSAWMNVKLVKKKKIVILVLKVLLNLTLLQDVNVSLAIILMTIC